MEDGKDIKHDLRQVISERLAGITSEELDEKSRRIEDRLFDFANFLESKIVLLYTRFSPHRIRMEGILKRCHDYDKIIVLPAFNSEKGKFKLLKVDDLQKDLIGGEDGKRVPNPARCKEVPIDCIDIAIIPGIAFDEKGGRIGDTADYYDKLMPDLPITTRKVALCLETQLVAQIPMESHDKFVDIIITEDRVIYKI